MSKSKEWRDVEDSVYRVVIGGLGWDTRLTEYCGPKEWCERKAQVLQEQWNRASVIPPNVVVKPIMWRPAE